MGRRTRMVVASLVAAAPLAAAASASGAGGPIIPGAAYGPQGATAPGSPDRYVTLFVGGEGVVARIQQDGGRVQETRSSGDYVIPAVTVNGEAGGLSADGSTLVLAHRRFGLRRKQTRFLLLDARHARLRVRDRISLRGAFGFDAISPDGSRIYLTEHMSRDDSRRYQVRAYDTRSDRILPEPIVDPEEAPGEMRGYPMSRVSSPDGRWAYTLYDGGEHPFIHALDTEDGRTVCIDVHALADARNPYRANLSIAPDGSQLTVKDRRRPVALVDTASFEVRPPPGPSEGASFPWPEVALVPLAGAGGWVLIRGLRRWRRATDGAG